MRNAGEGPAKTIIRMEDMGGFVQNARVAIEVSYLQGVARKSIHGPGEDAKPKGSAKRSGSSQPSSFLELGLVEAVSIRNSGRAAFVFRSVMAFAQTAFLQ